MIASSSTTKILMISVVGALNIGGLFAEVDPVFDMPLLSFGRSVT
jgi:hypothetical protein